MASDTKSGNHLERTIKGDLGAFEQLLKHPALPLEGRSRSLSAVELSASAVRNVLLALQRRTASPELVQRWASFVRRGYIERARPGPIIPLRIDYQSSAESAISEVLSRLDEIGDAIDGDVTADEIGSLLLLLA